MTRDWSRLRRSLVRCLASTHWLMASPGIGSMADAHAKRVDAPGHPLSATEPTSDLPDAGTHRGRG
ncbi:hypothetical protein [Glaciihabitans sp. dw_435]|uniref:hypothetical protein n=1 Tax=Glaciihabitans sp. dw_435 TaxID=2720081 RepID=UPI001BD4D00D|nr:hypothetical protein [Glaciihabitans sp. dw_435]